MNWVRAAALLAVWVPAGCGSLLHRSPDALATLSCSDRARQIVAENVLTITTHQYTRASLAAEKAARTSLTCANKESAAEAFDDRWRGANALVVAAELAHEANDPNRARRLLNEGYAIMHNLRPPTHVSDVTSSLIAQKLGTAREDLAGKWAYW